MIRTALIGYATISIASALAVAAISGLTPWQALAKAIGIGLRMGAVIGG